MLFEFLKGKLSGMWSIWCERTPKCLLNDELSGVHKRGRPRKRWLQDVKNNLR
jgi:hypothetical protein